jgi:hypothetical protein
MKHDCVSELMIDRLIAGELATDAAARVRDHAASCPVCGGLLGHAEAVARRFSAAPPPLRRPLRRSAQVGGAATALAAALALVIAAPWRSDPGGIRTKGGPSLGLFVSHGGAVRRGALGEVVAPGDQLQPVITAERAGWIAITAVDGAGLRTVYAAPQPVAAGRDRPLPFSIILDRTPGPTTLTAVFCPGPFALDPPPQGCTRDAFTLDVLDIQ